MKLKDSNLKPFEKKLIIVEINGEIIGNQIHYKVEMSDFMKFGTFLWGGFLLLMFIMFFFQIKNSLTVLQLRMNIS